MLDQIVRFSLVQRVFIMVVFAILVSLGALAWKKIPIDAFPDISPTQVKIIVKASGMTAEEIEAQITRPIETELLGIPKQTILRSTTKYAITSITLDFAEGTDIYWARQQVNERLNGLWASLPDIAEGGVAPMSTPLSEMFMFSIENPNLSLMERKHLLDWQIRPQLRTVAGVADVNILGGFTKTVQFTPDTVAIESAGLTLQDIADQVQMANTNGSVGRMDIGTDSMIIRTEGRIQEAHELGDIVITNLEGFPIQLKHLGEISIGSLARYGAVTKDGEETTEALVVALKDSNTADVVRGVRAKLEQLQSTLPPGTKLNVFYDRKNLIDTAVNTITSALFEAIVLVIVLLALFLGHVNASLVVSTSIPIAVIITFLMMNQWGLSANLMSLGGLVIAIGMLVDSSVVVVENIVTQLNKNVPLPRMHLIFRACKSIAKPVVAGTVIVIVVFIPLLTLTGLEGKLFSPVALTIVFAMTAALITSLTIIPVFSSLLIRSGGISTPKYLQRLQQLYSNSLDKVLHRPTAFIVVVMSLLVLSLGLFTQLGKTFMPVLDEGDIIVQLEKSPTISLNESIQLDQQIEKALIAEVPEIKQIVARTGSDELGLDPMGLNETDVFMELNPRDQWRFETKAELEQAIREVVQRYPGINFGFTQPIQMRVSEMLTGSTGTVTVKVFGEDIPTLAKLAEEISHTVKSTTGSIDVQMTLIEGGDYLNVVLHPEIASRYGMTTSELSNYLRVQITGAKISELIQGKVKTPIMFSSQYQGIPTLASIEEIRNLSVLMPESDVVNSEHSGRSVLLSDIADIKLAEGPAIIERENAQRFAVIATNVQGRDLVGFVEELQANVSQQVTLPANYSVEYGGEFENQIRATNNLLMVIPAVLLLIVIILFGTFRSLTKAGLILANVPFALMGGIFGLYLTGEYVSVPASIGFIALLGVAVLNGVVMLSHFEEAKAKAIPLTTLVITGAKDRLRPILMTASTAMFGLMPLVMATGPGAEIQKPLAIVVIGGLFSSTLVTLYFLPILYFKLENKAAHKLTL
ncbi:efflux RND transporter permease subunit [Paraneptunicella aestuarii]|uniref:efflux RND transporter permease subunit n=1 Tax=Paraneptunicella aestuarii TaxID=2831148 RepID=UPI001E4E72B7|nr:CusA/CzcA family heavy metal efflux RND transporter [Paraneptunicella aestuarii]UAA38642.1 efflux RND transporter permease subunit [Paraneptunicella aestuarii]